MCPQASLTPSEETLVPGGCSWGSAAGPYLYLPCLPHKEQATCEKAIFCISVNLPQQMSWGRADRVTPPQLQMAWDCSKCQTEHVSREASEWQLGQGVGKYQVTWPAGLYLQNREWVLDSQQRLRVGFQVVPENLVWGVAGTKSMSGKTNQSTNPIQSEGRVDQQDQTTAEPHVTAVHRNVPPVLKP